MNKLLHKIKNLFSFSKHGSDVSGTAINPFNPPEKPAVLKTFLIGIAILFIFLGGFVLWAALFPLESAAVVPGKIIVSTERKTIEHLEGGIVQKIYVKEGDIVKKGQKLILLDETQSKAQLEIVRKQSYALLAEEARLEAELDNFSKIQFPKLLLDNKDNPDIKKAMQGQKKIYNVHKNSLQKNIELQKKQITELHNEVNTLQSQIDTFNSQIKFFDEELDAMKKLRQKNYVEKTLVLKLERDRAETEGDREQAKAAQVRAKQRINETQLKIVNLKQDFYQDAVEKIRNVQSELSELSEKGISAEHILKRTIIYAPRAGRVVDLKIHTVGAVLTPGEPIMDIVPSDDPLVVDAQVNPLDIDVVHKGLQAKIRLIALKMRNTPTLNGTVLHVSADTLENKATGELYYSAYIEIPPGEFKKLQKNVELYPGMPVQVLIIIDKRTPLKYFLEPITDSFRKAFRES